MPETSPPRLDERQRAAVDHFDGPLEVIAGPGAGKTLILVERAALVYERGTPISGMVLVTFTTRAAGEMRDRLQLRLGMDVDSKTLRNVSTIHALAYRILRTAKKRAGQPGWRVVDENEPFDALRQAMAKIGMHVMVDEWQDVSQLEYMFLKECWKATICSCEACGP